MQISHEAIRLSLYAPRRRRAIGRGLTQKPRSGRPLRRLKIVRRLAGRGIMRGTVPITDRPTEVEDRRVPGPWEGDLVMGTRSSAVTTLVERTSRYTAIVALPDDIKAEQVTPHLAGICSASGPSCGELSLGTSEQPRRRSSVRGMTPSSSSRARPPRGPTCSPLRREEAEGHGIRGEDVARPSSPEDRHISFPGRCLSGSTTSGPGQGLRPFRDPDAPEDAYREAWRWNA
ncbi:transposase [Streptomyces filamentosus]|uniref:transposase n=1 Tax=Streptomyces filamentosus TaxID=67294 RepID=UPI0037CF548E